MDINVHNCGDDDEATCIGRVWSSGTVQPIEAGYYRPILRRVDGVWKIATMRIAHSLPMAFPGQ